MGSSKEDTLQVKSFKGLDREIQGTERSPDAYQAISNFFIPNIGELRSLNGVTKIANEIPGLQKIIHGKFLDTKKEKGAVVFYEPSTTLPSGPSGFTFSTSGGSAVTRDVIIEFVVAGGGRITRRYPGISIEANGLTVNVPSGFNAAAYYAVQSINIYICDSLYLIPTWCGCAWREDNEFPTSFVVFQPNNTLDTSNLLSIGLPVGSFKANPEYDANAVLEGDRLYYLGISPFFGTLNARSNEGPYALGYPEVNFKLASTLGSGLTVGNLFSVYVPEGQNKISFTFDYCALNLFQENIDLITSDLTMNRAVIYAGITPEDLMPSGGVGYGSSLAKATGTVTFDQTDIIGAPDYEIFIDGQVLPVGACIKFTKDSGTTPTNLSSNGYYYVKTSTTDVNSCFITLAISPGGDTVEVAAAGAGSFRFSWATYTGSITCLPKSSNIISSCAKWPTNTYPLSSLGPRYFLPQAVAGRGIGVTKFCPIGILDYPTINNITSVNTTTNEITIPNVKLQVGDNFKLLIGAGTIPPLVDATNYYVVAVTYVGDDSVVQISGTAGGAVIDLTAGTAGTSTIAGVIPNVDPHLIACGIFKRLDFNFNNFIHSAYPTFQMGINVQDYRLQQTQVVSPNADPLPQFGIPIANENGDNWIWEFESRQYGNRLWCVNNYNEPFYTNGYVLKSGVPSDPGASTFQRWPITKFIEFIKDRMILASDNSNQSYQDGYFYFSTLDTGSGDIQNFAFSSTTPNVLPVNTSDQSIINGLNVYSQNLSTVGGETFLVIGKEASVFTWNGDTASAAQQVSRSTGFAGPKCYCLSVFGAIYVGRDNVYLFRSAEEVIPIGDNIQDIIQGLTNDQLAGITAVFHEDHVKIAYSLQTDLDREIWLKMLYRAGAIQKIWTGPHELKAFKGESIIFKFDDNKNVRLSWDDTEFYRRDDPGTYLNDGQNMNRSIQITNLGLQYDDFLKLVTQLKIPVQIGQDEDVDFTFLSEDGSLPMVISTTLDGPANQTFMSQIQVKQRFLARVFSLTIENSSNGPLSLYAISILFKQIRRRRIGL